ncbi:hypothetical protein SCHPADRAFT_564758 [Schizopora paradoxa]|uniref:Uncharacterized protein n=1 Tax=Schizopora paradoxa TaxID=27342 RepID=A0A0H2RCE6_9AGAM|nr:hypothetical protein SCHPADRAFT_564758 [Schizopora paradoxa]
MIYLFLRDTVKRASFGSTGKPLLLLLPSLGTTTCSTETSRPTYSDNIERRGRVSSTLVPGTLPVFKPARWAMRSTSDALFYVRRCRRRCWRRKKVDRPNCPPANRTQSRMRTCRRVTLATRSTDKPQDLHKRLCNAISGI